MYKCRIQFLSVSFLVSVLVSVANLSHGQTSSKPAKSNQTASPEANPGGATSGKIEFWLTDPTRSVLFVQQPSLSFKGGRKNAPTIHVDPAQTFQTIDGFGYTLTGGSAMLINRMESSARAKLLNELFSTEGRSIGVSYLRVSIGASDLDEQVFSYDDLPAGETDPTLAKFSLTPDQQHLIPILKEILAINPTIKILGSPWSPPAWMKSNGNSKGGSLKLEFYDTYARYFVKYIQGMAKAGIQIDAVTIQNEPLHPGNNPSLLMLPAEQTLFIKKKPWPCI